jgi:hypothetical protein
VLNEIVPDPPALVPPRGPLATISRLSGSSQATPAGTSSYRYLAPNPTPPNRLLRVASSRTSSVNRSLVRSTRNILPAYPGTAIIALLSSGLTTIM